MDGYHVPGDRAMIAVSATYETLATNPNARYECRVLIDNVAYTENEIKEMQTNVAVFGDMGEPVIGRAVARTITVKVIDKNQSIPVMAEIIPQYRLTTGTTHSEWITKGHYFIDTRTTDYNGRFITLDGFDAMMKADRDYPGSSLSWPAKDTVVLAEIASILGVTIDSRTTAAMGNGYADIVPIPTGYSVREVLANIAALYAGCFVMSDDGKLLLVTLDGLPDVSGLLINEENRNITVDGGGVVV